MSDTISDEERILIDAAVAEGRVKRIPYGERTILSAEFTFSANSNKLIYADKEKGARSLRSGLKGCRPPRPRRGRAGTLCGFCRPGSL